jgi:hypothetical protein
MKTLEKFNALENKVVSRTELKNIAANLVQNGHPELAAPILDILAKKFNNSFKIEKLAKASLSAIDGLNAPANEGTKIYKDLRNGWAGRTRIKNINGYDWEITTSKSAGGKLVSSAQALKIDDEGNTMVSIFLDPRFNITTSKERATEKNVKKQHYFALNEFEEMREDGDLPKNPEAKNTPDGKPVIRIGLTCFVWGYNKESEMLYVYDIKDSNWGPSIKLVNSKTLEFSTTEKLRSYKDKFCIGVYYHEPPRYVDENKVMDLVIDAKAKETKRKKDQESSAMLSQVKRSAQIEEGKKLIKIPSWAKAVIVAERYSNDSDSMTDYFSASGDKDSMVLLAFSKSTRNNMSELKKAAPKFDKTAKFANDKKFEQRDNYYMLPKMYVGTDAWHGWKVHKENYHLNPLTEKGQNEIYIAAAQGRVKIESGPKKQPTESKSKITDSQGTATLNTAKGGIEVSFPGKPNPKIRECLKAAKFRWSRKNKVWYAKDTKKAREALKQCGIQLNINEASVLEIIKVPLSKIKEDTYKFKGSTLRYNDQFKNSPWQHDHEETGSDGFKTAIDALEFMTGMYSGYKFVLDKDIKLDSMAADPKADTAKVMATKKAKDCHAFVLPIKNIATDTDRFQNRSNAFSELTARNVADKFDANKFDPIVVWSDPKTNKDIVISGHSRLEGMKRRGAKEIPARYFKGTESEAIKFAKVDANRTADKESLVEDLEAYKLVRDGEPKNGIEPVSKTELKEAFPGKSNKLEAYSYLNPSGLFIQVLGQDNLSEYPHIESRAMWAGELAKENPKVWGKLMERNLFYFFYRDDKGIKLSKKDFFELAQKRLDTLKKGQQVLFPECENDGCNELQNEFANKLTGNAKKQLHEVKELKRFILQRFKTNKKELKVWTTEETDYLKKVVIPDLEKEADRIKKGIKDLEDNQGDLFGMNSYALKKKGLNGPVADTLSKVNNAINEGKKIVDQVKVTGKNVMSVAEMLNMKFDKLVMPGKWGEFLHNVPANFTAMVYGQGKNGKSSFSLQFAKMLATKGLVLYNFAEQGITATTQDLIKSMGIGNSDNIILSGGRTLAELRETLKAAKPKFVFIDLMNYYEISPDEMFRFMKNEFPQTAFILVMEATKDGNFKGDNGWLHIVDARIECKDFVATNSGRLGFGEFVIWPEKVAQLKAEKEATEN